MATKDDSAHRILVTHLFVGIVTRVLLEKTALVRRALILTKVPVVIDMGQRTEGVDRVALNRIWRVRIVAMEGISARRVVVAIGTLARFQTIKETAFVGCADRIAWHGVGSERLWRAQLVVIGLDETVQITTVLKNVARDRAYAAIGSIGPAAFVFTAHFFTFFRTHLKRKG